MKHITVIVLMLSLLSCMTIDMEKRGRDTGMYILPRDIERPEETEPTVVLTDEAVVQVVERPVYIPESTPVPASPQVRGTTAVRQSNADGIISPSEYSRAAMIYDYHTDWVYEIYTQPLRVSDVRLEPGEIVIETPFVSDSERWLLGAGVSFDDGVAVQHIYVKPSATSLEASLIINTDRRVYHLILKSYNNVYMPMVRWKYPFSGLPNKYITPPTAASAFGDDSSPSVSLDPRYISFNYRVRHNMFHKPTWLPELVFDDGKKTYIVFPKDVLQSVMPAVFDDRSNVVNYRVVEHIMIVDKLIQKLTVKVEKNDVIIEKKRG